MLRLNEALKVAFSSGAVMGLGVTGSGIIGLVILYGAMEGVYQSETRYLAGFGFGASAIALFARVGGGIYTKAADVGADLVGKVEEDIPEDDPRNPATIVTHHKNLKKALWDSLTAFFKGRSLGIVINSMISFFTGTSRNRSGIDVIDNPGLFEQVFDQYDIRKVPKNFHIRLFGLLS